MIEKKKDAPKSLTLRQRRPIPAPFAAFAITGILLTLLFAIIGLYPYGPHTIVMSDLSAQYAPDLVAFRDKLFSGGNLSYSFLISMGKNTLGVFAYYLASPLNIVTFLFPANQISASILCLMTLKLSLAGSFMTFFLSRRYPVAGKKAYTILFGILYAFCSYSMGFLFNIMWFDGFLLLPLLLYAVERFMKKRSEWWIATILLTILFVSGFYIAYMVGLFSFFYLLFRMIEERRITEATGAEAGKTIFGYIGAALIAALLSAAILVPAGLDILRNKDMRVDSLRFGQNFTLLSFLNQLLAGSFDTLAGNNPLIYVGLAGLFLCMLFFLNPGIPRRRKALAGTAFALFLLSFLINYVNLAWHLFDSPNWFLYRYSFLFSFIAISVAFESFLNLRSLRPKDFVKVGVAFLALLFFVQGFGDLKDDGARFIANLIYGAAELGALYLMTGVPFPKSIANLKRLLPAFFVLLVCTDVVIMNPLFMRPKIFGGETENAAIVKEIDAADALTAKASDDADADDVLFWRMEKTGADSAVDTAAMGLYQGYPSISTFNSASDKQLDRLLKQFGMNVNYNYFAASHDYSSIVPDTLFGIRYTLTQSDDTYGYERIAESGDWKLLKNASALPLLYSVQKNAGDYDAYSLEKMTSDKNLFRYQDEMLVSLFGEAAFATPVYSAAEVGDPEIYNAIPARPLSEEEDQDASSSTNSSASHDDPDRLGEEPTWDAARYETRYLRISDLDPIELRYKVNITSSDPLYLAVSFIGVCGNADILVDGKFVSNISDSFYSQMINMGSFEPGDSITVTLRSPKDSFSILSADFAYCDTALFAKELAAAKPNDGITIRQVRDGYLFADTDLSEDRLLLTTIPYEDGWTLRVDGVKVEVQSYQDAFIAIPIGAGHHTVELSFAAPGLVSGRILSGVGLAAAAVSLAVTTKRKRKNEGRKKD